MLTDIYAKIESLIGKGETKNRMCVHFKRLIAVDLGNGQANCMRSYDKPKLFYLVILGQTLYRFDHRTQRSHPCHLEKSETGQNGYPPC